MIVLLLAGLSTVACGHAQAKDIARCVSMGLDDSTAKTIGYGLKKTKWQGYQFSDEHTVTMQPRMAGLLGPSVTLLGRDTRLAVTMHQTSPQELWHKSRWNEKRVEGCKPAKVRSFKQFLRALYWTMRLDTQIGHSTGEPAVLYRSRAVVETLFTRPYGFVFGASVATGVADNTAALLRLRDTRKPVRRDIAQFSDEPGMERLFGSWRHTPFTDVHVAFNAGLLEEMYGGAGMEVVWRPFGSAFWAGADVWKVWRRDPASTMHTALTDETHVTGHVRVGYDVPDTRMGVQLAAGRYLGDDWGGTLAMQQTFENGLKLEAAMTWTDREEPAGALSDTRFDPSVRATWPLGPGKHKEMRVTARQVGRDAGQMLDRPLPLEQMTQGFAAREIIRDWPKMFD